jgi:hypothetical protein
MFTFANFIASGSGSGRAKSTRILTRNTGTDSIYLPVYIGREGATPQPHQQDGNGLAEVEAQPPHHQAVVGGGEGGQ